MSYIARQTPEASRDDLVLLGQLPETIQSLEEHFFRLGAKKMRAIDIIVVFEQ